MAKTVAPVKPPPAISTRNKPIRSGPAQGLPPKNAVHQIVDGLLPLAVSLKDIRPDPANERTHARANLEAVKGSLLKFGQREPLVVNANTGKIEAGHGRYTVMTELGWTHAAVILVDDDAKTAAGFRIAANRTAELADWDEAKLVETLRTLSDATFLATGFTDEELARIEKGLRPPEPSEPKAVKPTFGKEITCPSCNHKWSEKS